MKNIKNKKLLAFGIILLLILIISIYFVFFRKDFQTNIPTTPQITNPPISEDDVRQLEDYDSSSYARLINQSENDFRNVFGDPINTTSDDNYKYLQYPSQYQVFPTTVYSEEGRIALVKEVISESDPRFEKKIAGSEFINSASFTLYTTDFGPSYPVEIFPTKGIAFVKHETSQNVFQIWYFQPSSRDIIINTWGSDLITPEEFEFHN